MKYILVFLIFMGTLFASIGEITAIHGKAYALRGGKSIVLAKGSKLEKRDTIKTLANTRLQIVFIDHTVISLGQRTNFKVDKYDFNRHNKEARFSVSRGIFKSITGKIGHLNHSKYTLKTNNATIGVRGTIYVGRIEPNKESIACTSGEIVVYTKRGSVVVKKGEITTFTPYSAPVKPKRYKENTLKIFQGVVSKEDISAIKKLKIKTLKKSKVKVNIKTQKIKSKINHNNHILYQDVSDTLEKSNPEKENKKLNSKEEIQSVDDGYGDFASEDIENINLEDEKGTTKVAISDYSDLIQKAGNSKLKYIGKVSGKDIANDNQNRVDLDFDIGKASVKGSIKFVKTNHTSNKINIHNYNTQLEGSVNTDGKFDFHTTSNRYAGGGNGVLSGEHLEQANGNFNISKTEGNSIDKTVGTFTTKKQ